MLAPRGLLARALSAPPLRGIGRVSYGMYLLHLPVIDLVRALTPNYIALSITAAAVTFALAFLMYHLYERRFLRLKLRYTPPREALCGA